MIPTSRLWKVTFFMLDGTAPRVTTVLCVKRFALGLANEVLGYPANDAHKITVGLVRKEVETAAWMTP